NRAEARAVVGYGEIVVDGLRHVDGDHRIAERGRELRHLETRVGRLVAAVEDEVADVVRPEDFAQAHVLRAALVQALQLVAARAECACGRVQQCGDRARRLLARVDQIFGQRADDAVAPRIDLADFRLVLARRFDDRGSACVDDGGHAARLRVESVALWHVSSAGPTQGTDSPPSGAASAPSVGVVSSERFLQAPNAARQAARTWSTLPSPFTLTYLGARGLPVAAHVT